MATEPGRSPLQEPTCHCGGSKVQIVLGSVIPCGCVNPPKDWTSEFPLTLVCTTCGYIGWPSTTDLAGGGYANYCPRGRDHGEMRQIKITDFEALT